MPEWKDEIRQRLANLKLEPTREAEIIEELAQHLDDRYAELLARGATPDDALHAALAELNDSELLTQELRRVERSVMREPVVLGVNRRRNLMADLWQDLRYAVRMLRKNPGFTAIAVLSLALGIGANTAIFSVIDALMLKPLPVQQPEQLFTLAVNYPGGARPTFVFPTFKKFRDQLQEIASLSAVCLLDRANVTINGPRGVLSAGQARVGLVSGNYFSMLGLNAALGRTLTSDDDRVPGGHPVAVISQAFWQRHLAHQADVIGRTLNLNGTTYTIVGVTPTGFSGEWVGRPADLWIPIAMQSQVMLEQPGLLTDPTNDWVRVVARVKPSVPLNQFQASAQVVFHEWMEETFSPSALQRFGGLQVILEPAARGFSPERKFLTRPLVILMILVGLVLAVACANVASLLLARATARRREMAVRLALGAARGRIIRQLLTESVLLAMIGGALGLLLAQWGTHALAKLVVSSHLSIDLDLHPEARIFAFTAALCLLTGLLFGLMPAFQAAKVSLTAALKEGSAEAGNSLGRFRLGKALVVSQVALSLVLLVGAGLFVRTLRNLKSQDFGVDREHVLLAWAAPGQAGRTGPALQRLYQTVQERISSLPGVMSASLSHGGNPPTGFMSGVFLDSPIRLVEGQTIQPGEERRALWYVAAPRFFEAMGMTLVAGRDFTAYDNETAPQVAIINEAMARHYFGHENPIGKHFGFSPIRPIEIVGVVKAEKFNSPRDENRMLVFLPSRQDPNARFAHGDMLLAVRINSNPTSLASRIRQELHEIDPDLPVLRINTMEEELDRSLVQERLVAALAGFFGALAVVLACIGLYGVLSYTTARRTNEIGIRLALGATRANVLCMILRESLSLVGIGIAIGLTATLASMRLIATLLFGISAADPLTMVAALLLLSAVAALAAFLPARRAAQVDPMIALRCE